uniref:CSON014617 protein n=1 Tax=Culicoides sonorensis TaxID=179676 RepID=A0A336MF36_CULSO
MNFKSSNLYYELTLADLRKLAYQYAVKLTANYPKSWDKDKITGKEWSLAFRKRNPRATGHALPPVYVFPRVKFKAAFLNGAPLGSVGLAHKSGYMVVEIFTEALKHIQRQTNCSKDNKVLLLLDNHESHCSIQAIECARELGIVLLTFPPHTSHKIQPLDVSVYGPFKTKFKIAFKDWLSTNVGKVITIYQIAALSKNAFLESFTERNIMSGFVKPGIYPLNRFAFQDSDFAPTYPEQRKHGNTRINCSIGAEITVSDPGTSTDKTESTVSVPETLTNIVLSPLIQQNKSSSHTADNISPESVRPLPKILNKRSLAMHRKISK